MLVFETLIVCPCLLIANTTLLAFKTLLFLFFSKICASKLGVRLIYGCGLYMDVYGSQKEHTEIDKIPKFGVNRASFD